MNPIHNFLRHMLSMLACLPLFMGIVSAQDITLNITHTCSNANEGSIAAAVLTEDYVPPFTFTWTDAQNNPIPAGQIVQDPVEGTSTVSGLAVGEYCVVVTSEDGCNASGCGLVVEELPVLDIQIVPTCICPNGYGALSVEVTGGSGSYGFAWKTAPGNDISNPTIPDPIVYSTGTYTVIVTDSQTGCTASATATVGHCDVDPAELLQDENPSEKALAKKAPVGNGISIRPNPFFTEIELIVPEVEADFRGQLIILDNLAREIVKKEANFATGYNSIKLDGLERLPEGVYIIIVKKDGGVYGYQKAVKVN